MEMLWTIFLRMVFMYFFLFVTVRIMKKKEIGQLSLFDLIVSFMIADIATIVLKQGGKEPLIHGIAPIIILVALQRIFSSIPFQRKNSYFHITALETLFRGKVNPHSSLKPFQMPTPVIVEGKVQDEVLARLGYTRFWLKNQIQQGGYKYFREIFYASISQEGKIYIDHKNSKEKP
jgi:uncharacterized membrane protein YcaP (DUF421 family)